MKKLFNYLGIAILGFLLTINVYAKDNPYPKTETSIFGNQIINCTWYAWQQAKDRMGVELPLWYNVETWYSKAEQAGYSVGKEAKADSIMVWNYGEGFGGHVAYVTAVDGDNVTYIEGGSPMTEDGINEDTMTLEMMDTFLVGFIYLDKVPEEKKTTTTEKEVTAEKETIKQEDTKPKETPKSTNNNLSDLQISVGEIEFNKDTLEYNFEVLNDIEKVTINAIPEDAKASIEGNNTYDLQEGMNKIVVSVTAENGEQKNYIVNINRKEKDNKIDNKEVSKQEENVNNKKSNNKILIIISIVILIILVTSFAFVLYKKAKK